MDEWKLKKYSTLKAIGEEINDQIVKGRGIYLINTREGLVYVFDAIAEYLNMLEKEEDYG